ncbi:winged helix-turn-helix transcriptional regulator [Actinomycetospora straminea]|uniref:Helix-turn-helix domain-containing protein n=1 Tax=Actinomycetospora straminea TaxID=663607 RepID=A0ABP9EAZ7_9PSEU|nr:helix-turn-helix domain-containing protein [Actinomycetospora straminea]MDD7935317.1 helix-turn-helix domain-containing protein [Actinomycetospora straminea]
MLGKTYDREVCSAARALELVGERWSLLIVRNALFAGARRFGDFRSLGIATNVLTTRLEGFVAAGIMERDGDEYLLTAQGRELAAVVVALTAWGDRYLAPDGPPILYTHATCGNAVEQHLVCASCGDVHDAREVVARPGPGMPAEIAARMTP